MAERQLEHRIDFEGRALQAEIDDGRRGQYLSATLVALLIVCGTAAALLGHAAGFALVIGTGLVAAINTVWRRVEERKERQRREEDREGRQLELPLDDEG